MLKTLSRAWPTSGLLFLYNTCKVPDADHNDDKGAGLDQSVVQNSELYAVQKCKDFK